MAYRVMIGDLYCYMDEDARYEAGVRWSAREHILTRGAALLAAAHATPSPPDGATA